ncbi:MAG: hypothetical protein DMG40_23815 [Acidobacteria bacterium]|nr:MAG: hypothetical protein DMG40_23815 [Acidobacteriota bacterium]
MRKPIIFVLTPVRASALITFVAAAVLLPLGQAQQTPASGASQTPPAATTQTKPASSAQANTPVATTKRPGATKSASASKAAAPLTLTTDKDKISYAIGMNVGKAMKKDGVDVDTTILLHGLKDALAGSQQLLTDQEAQAVLSTLQTELRKKLEQQQQQLAETNKKEGDEFLAANKAKEGVVTLPSGLEYKILQEGTGPKPTAADTVTVNYRGTLLNGTEFDSSYKRGQPANFPVSQIIKGWTEALELMPVGSKWQLFIPPDLAYGLRGANPTIGPNSTLIFEVELLSIQPKAAPAAGPAPQAPPAAANAAPATPAPSHKPVANPAPPPASTPKP